MQADDMDLVRQFALSGSEEAFAALVRRHVNLVYSVALRQLGNPHDAEEVAQAVFIILARKAPELRAGTVLSGWLYQTARLTSANFQRAASRRRHREQEAFMQFAENSDPDVSWQRLSPLLEEAMARLGQKERDAVVLRFFENRTVREVGAALGLEEAAAQKRVNRATDKLRAFFVRRGVQVSTVTLLASLGTHAVQAAPAELAAKFAAAAALKGAAASGSTLALIKSTLKLMAWTKTKVAVVTVVGILLTAGTATIAVNEFQTHRAYRGSWQVKEITLDPSLLTRMQPVAQILPTKFADFNSVSDGIGIVASHGKMAGLGQPVSEIIMRAYGASSPVRTAAETGLPPGEFDFITTTPGAPMEALQQEIKNQFGLVARHEMRETNVLLLRVKNPNAPGLQPTSGKTPYNSAGPDHISVVNDTLWPLDMFLETYFFKLPVIDQTGLTGHYDYQVKLNAHGNPQFLDPDGLKQALLDQLGLELVPAREAIDLLVIEKAAD
jgi:uncharacterized protein (TIGR03435 family)